MGKFRDHRTLDCYPKDKKQYKSPISFRQYVPHGDSYVCSAAICNNMQDTVYLTLMQRHLMRARDLEVNEIGHAS